MVFNDPPIFQDPGGAFADRFVKVAFPRKFEEWERDLGLEPKLRPELPGIAARCLRVYWRLVERGWFVQPASVAKLEQEMALKANPYLRFMHKTFELDTEGRVSRPVFWMKWQAWNEENKRLGLSIANLGELVKEVRKIGEPYAGLLADWHRTGTGTAACASAR